MTNKKVLQHWRKMNAMVTNPSSDFSRVYKELLNSLQRQQQQLQNSLFQSGLPYLDPALFLQSMAHSLLNLVILCVAFFIVMLSGVA